jgi:hypothetical protein
MKVHTTNYQNTLIQIAEDCPATFGEVPPTKGDVKSVANIQFDMLYNHPYEYTSDDVLFQVFAERNDLTEEERVAARVTFFSKGQACMRCSPLTKRYGWGVHHDAGEKIALFGAESADYQTFSTDNSLKTVKAMKSKK